MAGNSSAGIREGTHIMGIPVVKYLEKLDSFNRALHRNYSIVDYSREEILQGLVVSFYFLDSKRKINIR